VLAVLHYPFDLRFQRLQPIVCLGDDLYVKTGQRPAEATLVSALGVRHPLRRLGSARDLAQSRRRSDAPVIGRMLTEALCRHAAADVVDGLRYFVEVLVPAFGERDWREDYLVPAAAPPARHPSDLLVDVAARGEEAPLARLPSPSLLVLGRVWLLRPAHPGPGRMQVHRGEEALEPSGEYHLGGTLERQWHKDVDRFLRETAEQMAAWCVLTEDGATLRDAREAVARAGCFVRGDLLFLAGSPPRLGYLLPPHYNRSLGRQSGRDLALTAPLTLPPKVSYPTVFQRTAAGRWERCPLPHGLCLGSGPPGDLPESPGVALAAFLRWAALRVAANGIFHSSDNYSSSDA
jgi:hypothetical protein